MTREEIFNQEEKKTETIRQMIEEYWFDEERQSWSKNNMSSIRLEVLESN